MNKIYTPEQMAVLAKYEDYLRTAARSDWARYPGIKALEEIHAVDDEALGKATILYSACGNCVLNLLRSVGKRYFAQKEAEERLLKLKDGADVGALAKEIEETFDPKEARPLVSVTETAQISAQKPKTGKGSTAKKPARKPKK